MLLFPIYAVLIWSVTMYWRRRWPAFVAVALSVLSLLMLGRLFMAYEYWFPPTAKLFYEMLWPYTFLVGGMGLYIACLPRRVGPNQCKKCHYDLSGLDPRGLTCPECGTEWCGPGSGKEPPPVELIPIPKGPPMRRRSL